MEGSEQKIEQNVEDMDIIKQFMKIMEQQSRQEQSQDFMEVFRYMAGMQVQLGVMADELQNVRKQLSDMQNTNPKAENRLLVDKVSHLRVKISGLSKRVSAVKNHFVDTIAKSVTAFRKKGKQEMNKVLNKGISGIKSMLAGCREKMVDLLTDYEKTANQIDSIGDEIKQIGNSFANVGRLVTGKGTKEISEEKPGVGFTRLINMPIKRNIEALRHHIEKVDRAMNKLDTISAGLEPEEKKAEKGEKPKEKSAQKPKKEENQKEKTDKPPEKEETSKGQSEKQAGEEKPQKKAEEKEKPAQKTEKGQTPEKNPFKKDMEKGAEKKERVSVKEKLSEMKAKSEQQKKEPEAAKTKSKEECL